MMKKWLQTAKPDDRGESLRALQEVSKERITSVANQYFTNLWGVGGSQGRGAPSIEYRDRQKAKEQCVKIFVEKYDTVTAPSGEGQAVRKQMTVQVEDMSCQVCGIIYFHWQSASPWINSRDSGPRE